MIRTLACSLLLAFVLMAIAGCSYQVADTRQDMAALAAAEQGEELWVIARTAPKDQSRDMDALRPGILLAAASQAPATDRQWTALPLLHNSVHAEVRGLTCDISLAQTFRNPHRKPIDAVYRFQLPDDARVTGFIMRIGPRKIRGIFREPKDAERLFDAANQRGLRASLIIAGADNTLTQQVSNIQPDKPIGVDLRYQHALEHEGNTYRLTVPLAQTTGDKNTDVGASSDFLEIAVDLHPGIAIKNIHSGSHPIEPQRINATSIRVTLAGNNNAPRARDFDLAFEVPDGHRLAHAEHAVLATSDHDAAVAVDATRPGDN